jgi:hypothetical protein
MILSAFTCGQTQTEQQQPTHIESIMVGTPSATTLSMKHKKLPKLLHKMFMDLIFFRCIYLIISKKNLLKQTNKQNMAVGRKKERKKEERD